MNYQTMTEQQLRDPASITRRVPKPAAYDRREEAFDRGRPLCYRTRINQQTVMVREYPNGRLEQLDMDANGELFVSRVIRQERLCA